MAQVDSETTTAMPASDAGALYIPTDITPEEVFQAIGRLRKEARDEIHRLIGFLDKTDDYVSRELEDQVDDDAIDEDEREPSLCGVTVGATNTQPDFRGIDLEGDEREDDEDTHDREEINEDGDGNPDSEPSLGWTIDGVISPTSAEGFDAELHGSAPRDILEKRLRRGSSRVELRWLDGTPVTAENIQSRPSNVINLDSANL
jgi:hypothetical protein